MNREGSVGPGVLLASAAAGPIFMISYAAAHLYLQLPAPIIVEPLAALRFAILLLPALAVGFLVSAAPNIFAATLLAALAEHCEPARLPLFWAAIGAALGADLSYAVDMRASDPAVAFGLIVTSAACGRLCRTSIGRRALRSDLA